MSARIREVRLGAFDLVLERRPDGTIRARSPHPLGAYPSRLTARLEHWAEHAPERTFLAKRDAQGGWRRLTYAKTLEGVRRIGQALLEEPLSIDAQELTDKGTINQRAVLTHRAHLVEELYTPPYSPRVLVAAAGS